MAINLQSDKLPLNESNKEIKERFETKGRKPEEALNGMYGLWQNSSIT